MTPFLLFERQGAIVTLRMNRPEQRNAITDNGQIQEFVDACDAINDDISIKAVILTGVGSAFCAGGNVKDMGQRAGMFAGSPAQLRHQYRNGIQRIPVALYNLEAPVVAAVNGAAIGAGLDLACMCDVRIASETASFAESFIKLGIVPGDGGAWLLPRAVGAAKAAEMALTGDSITAAEALDCKLVSKVVPPEGLEEAARALANRMAANPAEALRMTKRLLREGQHVRLESLLEMSAAFQALAHHTGEHMEAVQAFLNGRTARSKEPSDQKRP
jgi:enoyl-CoA hydratase/carnithine racemase